MEASICLWEAVSSLHQDGDLAGHSVEQKARAPGSAPCTGICVPAKDKWSLRTEAKGRWGPGEWGRWTSRAGQAGPAEQGRPSRAGWLPAGGVCCSLSDPHPTHRFPSARRAAARPLSEYWSHSWLLCV